MALDKQQVLYWAPQSLNMPNQPWYVTVEGDAIIARWKWMDAVWFAPQEVSKEIQAYTFTVTLKDNGKYKEIDTTEKDSTSVSFSNGKIGFGTSKSGFVGKQTAKKAVYGIGMNSQTGEAGIVGFKYATETIKTPVRAYLEGHGWQKAGLFG